MFARMVVGWLVVVVCGGWFAGWMEGFAGLVVRCAFRVVAIAVRVRVGKDAGVVEWGSTGACGVRLLCGRDFWPRLRVPFAEEVGNTGGLFGLGVG